MITPISTVPLLNCNALLFDLDGVLVDSNPVYETHWLIWAQERDVSYQHILEVHHGRPVSDTIRVVAPHLDPITEAEAYRQSVIADNHLERVRSFPGVSTMLKELPPDRWAIVTSAPRAFALKTLHYLDLPMPKVFVSSEDIGVGKPAPYPYLRAAWGLNQSIEDCIVVEDAPAGIQSAKAAGARIIAVQTTNSPDVLHEADFLVNEVSDLTIVFSGSNLKVTLDL